VLITSLGRLDKHLIQEEYKVMHRQRFLWTGIAAAGSLVVGGVVYRAFAAEVARANARVGIGSQVFQTRFGSMEYAVAGDGSLKIRHGSNEQLFSVVSA
jgi:hypothetical protein